MLIMSVSLVSTGLDSQGDRITKIDDIKHLGTAVFCYAGKKLAIRAGRDTDYGRCMGTVMFHELDSLDLLLPPFDMSINRGGYQKVSSTSWVNKHAIYASSGHALGEHRVNDGVAVHERLVVSIGRGQVIQIQFFMGKNYACTFNNHL
jgi:hypothetical protein